MLALTIVIAGGAGLAIGGAMILPGDRTRLASVQAVAGDIVIIVCGAAVIDQHAAIFILQGALDRLAHLKY